MKKKILLILSLILIFIIAFFIGFYTAKQFNNPAKYFSNENINRITKMNVICNTKDDNQVEIEAILRI